MRHPLTSKHPYHTTPLHFSDSRTRTCHRRLLLRSDSDESSHRVRLSGFAHAAGVPQGPGDNVAEREREEAGEDGAQDHALEHVPPALRCRRCLLGRLAPGLLQPAHRAVGVGDGGAAAACGRHRGSDRSQACSGFQSSLG